MIKSSSRKVTRAPLPGLPGPGVDKLGNQVIDPTKNVLDLVDAGARYQDGMRNALEKYEDAMRAAEIQRLDQLAAAETRRVNALEDQRVRYEARIAEDLRVNVKTTSDQLAGQLIKETGALNNQITTLTTSVANQFTTLTTSLTNQMITQTAGINTRLADLERFRWETGGKSAVSDPALSVALSEMAKSIVDLKNSQVRDVGREEQKTTHHSSMTLGVAAVVAVIAFGALIEPIILHFVH